MKGLLYSGILFCTLSTVSLAEAVIAIPFTLDESAVPIATLSINGQQGQFMLDTGSSFAFHFDQQFIRQVPWLIRLKEKVRTTDLTGEVLLNDHFKFHHVSVNGMSFEHVEGVSLSSWGLALQPGGKRPESMVIGLGLFRQKALMIDYQQSLFTVANRLDDLHIDRHQWLTLPLKLTEEGIIIEAVKHNETYNMLLDTGATLSMIWNENLKRIDNVFPCREMMAELDDEDCQATNITLKHATRGKVNIDVVLLNNEVEQMTADGILGTNFLQHHRVLIDFPNQQLLMRAIEPG
ncbi:hypothetical protein PRCB_05920 [Pantoea rodasii]|uniref:Peptidase A2 domain-containing protein n=1 Tax=Pantoea rodasii TaxID=1076549 RepID=A0A2M9WFH9_9GAMM|nr:hypothetical protein [Pantoea rodasii]ORM57534.1 hypothetical protein HA45_24845 [Pantoea rodasii]PJZ06259.1 hypothetical protein PRCB_05920 [Pantoea rodasii]